jgi:hypothetical protein
MLTENNSAVETAVTTPPAGTETAAGEKEMNAMQKFFAGLFGAEKKTDTAKNETDPEKKDDDDTAAGKETTTEKSYTQKDLEEALAAEKAKWQKDAEEQARRAKLTPEEQAKLAENDTKAKIEKLEAQLLQKELKESAVAALSKDGYPVSLADLLQYDSKESMEQSLATLQAAYKESLAAAVKEKLRGKTPEGLGGAAGSENAIRDDIAKGIRGGI